MESDNLYGFIEQQRKRGELITPELAQYAHQTYINEQKKKRNTEVMKGWWKRLWCLHYWIKGFEIDIEYGRGFLYPYTCIKCGKQIKRWSGDDPISYVERK